MPRKLGNSCWFYLKGQSLRPNNHACASFKTRIAKKLRAIKTFVEKVNSNVKKKDEIKVTSTCLSENLIYITNYT